MTFYETVKIDSFVKSQKTPSPLMGEGRDEGENTAISSSYAPITSIPSHQGRENPTFYGRSLIDSLKKFSFHVINGSI